MKLSREERRNCIGIAMSGGGLQGIAHIGAIKALYELGIHPQFVSGTSSGAAMAAITAANSPLFLILIIPPRLLHRNSLM